MTRTNARLSAAMTLVAVSSLTAARAQNAQVLASAGSENAQPPMLEEVIVTALKQKDQTLTRAPASISVISGEQIESMGSKSLTDFLQLAPGLSIDQSQDAGPGFVTIQIRGLNTTFGASSVGYYIDGVPFGLQQQNWLPNPSPFDLDRVEVLKGPQGTLYGAGASGGVVLVETENPNMTAFQVKGEASGSDTHGGSGNASADGAVNVPIVPRKIALRVMGTYDVDSGWINSPATGARGINGDHHTHYRAKLRITPTDRLTIQLADDGDRNQFGAENIADDAGNFPDYDRYFSGHTSYDISSALISYAFPSLTVTSTTGYIDFRSLFGEAFAPGVDVPSTYNEHSFSQELRVNSAGESDFSWVAGTLYRNAGGFQYQNVSALGVPFNSDDRQPQKQWNTYAQGTLAMLDRRLELTAGGSYYSSKYTDIGNLAPFLLTPVIVSQDTSAFSPKVSIAYHPTVHSTLYATYSKGLRYGLPESGFLTFLLRTLIPTASGTVGPETDKAYEIGAKGDFMGGRLHAEGDLFLTDISNTQQAIAFAVPGTSVPANSIVNAGPARSSGAEWLLAARPINGLTVSVSGSYTKAIITQNYYAPGTSSGTPLFAEGSPLTLVPRLTLNGTLDWAHSVGELDGTASLVVQHSSRRYLTVLSSAPIPGDNVTQLNARYEIGRGGWSTFLFVNNLTNEQGDVSPSAFDQFLFPHTGTIGTRFQPRTIGAGVRFSY